MYGLQRVLTQLVLLRRQLELVNAVTPESKGILKAINLSMIDTIKELDDCDAVIAKDVSAYERRIEKLGKQLKEK